ncbi:hypothetical protein [Nannocystis sp. SCPEA4]|uniref:hypothetical protein n=1 Tax=Nannocystis sp. SCPEA4 TaxID=2996787 RepID=UPI00226F4F57|nr:hypothetical protein [Nannocystis sp. SCPEA4]MCY1057453.1 hypothetical protein [Nannocystis sp. SCPEA4]
MVQQQGPTQSTYFPYEADFVWPNDIRFTFFGAQATHRAMYILRPRIAGVWALGNQVTGSWPLPLIVGVAMGEPGYRVVKMEFATFLEK